MKVDPAKWTRFRILLVLGFFVLIWGGIIWRAFQLQVVEREHLAGLAKKECQRVININPVRGDIYDRRGEKLAVSVEADSIFADPASVEDPETTAARLSSALNLNSRDVLKKLKAQSTFVWLKRQVGPEESKKVAELNLKGVYSLQETKRFYPNKELAANLLGFVGIDSQGLEGLEIAYDEYLRGGCSSWRVTQDALGRTFLGLDSDAPPGFQGARINLTIDRRIQYTTEKALAKVVEDFNAKGGLAVVLRTKTGEVLASAVEPSFNPNAFASYSAAQRRNRVLTDTFDPGSTFKVFIVAAALEEGLVKPTDLVFCENGEVVIDRHTIHDTKPHGWLTVNKVVKYSSNIGALKIGEMLGPPTVHRYLERFGFGQRTGVDLPGESAGLLRPYKAWRKLDAANVAFGQGVSTTAFQMTSAMSAIANDGVLMRPYIVSEIVDSDGRVLKRNKPEAVRQVVSPQTAREVREMLRMVVEEGGTGTRAETDGYPVAGKTGTAQKLDPETKRYSDKKYFSSFLGFVPYEDPQLTIFVALDEPSPQAYGGVVAAPAFREIAEKVLPIMDIAPVNPTPEQLLMARAEESGSTVNRQTIQKIKDLAEALKEEAMAAAPAPAEAEARPEPEAGAMPDLVGLSMRRVMEMMAGYNVDLNFTGSGLAVWQTPPPGQTIKAGQVCSVRFEQ